MRLLLNEAYNTTSGDESYPQSIYSSFCMHCECSWYVWQAKAHVHIHAAALQGDESVVGPNDLPL